MNSDRHEHAKGLTRRDIKRLRRAASAGITPELTAAAIGASDEALRQTLGKDEALRADLAARAATWEQALLGRVRRRATDSRAARRWLAERGLARTVVRDDGPKAAKPRGARPAGTALAIAISVAPAATPSVSRLELNGRHAAKVS